MEIRIYVANLAQYNNGRLVGKWIDLPCDDLQEQINSILGDDEEYAIHDYEASFSISEYDCPFDLNDIAERLESLDEYEQKKLTYLLDDGCTMEQAIDELDDITFYQDMSLKDVAEEMVDEGLFGDIPESIINYIDYDAIARDLSYDGYHETNDGVFCRH